MVVAGDGIGIIEGIPLPGDYPARIVAGNFMDETMSNHNFSHIPIILVEMDKERLSVEDLPGSFGTAKFLIGEVGIDSATGNVLRPVPPHIYEGLTIDAVIVHGNDYDRNTEPTVHRDDLDRVVDGLRHLKHEGGCLLVAWKLGGECPTPIRILRAIFTLLKFQPPHDWIPL